MEEKTSVVVVVLTWVALTFIYSAVITVGILFAIWGCSFFSPTLRALRKRVKKVVKEAKAEEENKKEANNG